MVSSPSYILLFYYISPYFTQYPIRKTYSLLPLGKLSRLLLQVQHFEVSFRAPTYGPQARHALAEDHRMKRTDRQSEKALAGKNGLLECFPEVWTESDCETKRVDRK